MSEPVSLGLHWPRFARPISASHIACCSTIHRGTASSLNGFALNGRNSYLMFSQLTYLDAVLFSLLFYYKDTWYMYLFCCFIRCERDSEVHLQPLPQVTGVDKNNLFKVGWLVCCLTVTEGNFICNLHITQCHCVISFWWNCPCNIPALQLVLQPRILSWVEGKVELVLFLNIATVVLQVAAKIALCNSIFSNPWTVFWATACLMFLLLIEQNRRICCQFKKQAGFQLQWFYCKNIRRQGHF